MKSKVLAAGREVSSGRGQHLEVSRGQQDDAQQVKHGREGRGE